MASQQINMTWKEFAKKHPEYFSNKNKKKIPNSKLRFMCQCKRGHIFDYRKRIRYPDSDKYHSPCQGMCPYCGESRFSFLGNGEHINPVKFNFLG